MKIRMRDLAEKFRVDDLFVKRLVFSAFMLPTVINLFLFSALINEGREFVLGCAAVFAVYFVITFAFEIKTERWTVFTLLAVAVLSILISLFFILAYKLHELFALLGIEIAAAVILTLLRNKLPRPKDKAGDK